MGSSGVCWRPGASRRPGGSARLRTTSQRPTLRTLPPVATPVGSPSEAASAPARAPATAPKENSPCQVRHQHLATALLDQVPLHVDGDVTDAGAQTGYQQHQRQHRHRTGQRDIAQPPRQSAVATRLTVCEGTGPPAGLVNGIPRIDPIPTQTSANASCVGVAPTWSRIPGIRENDDAITKPLPKNITATANGEPIGDAIPVSFGTDMISLDQCRMRMSRCAPRWPTTGFAIVAQAACKSAVIPGFGDPGRICSFDAAGCLVQVRSRALPAVART